MDSITGNYFDTQAPHVTLAVLYWMILSLQNLHLVMIMILDKHAAAAVL